jgi:hypothetical protein
VARELAPEQLRAMTEAYLNNAWSFEQYYYNLQKGEMARPGIDVEDEQALIDLQKEQQPLAPPLTVGGPPRNGQTRTAA